MPDPTEERAAAPPLVGRVPTLSVVASVVV